ncbi:hypothetical protein A2U01_0082608, partial [Trifolium medium]|nr:hypothetical protein [Trifolium medium]
YIAIFECDEKLTAGGNWGNIGTL